MKKSFTLLFLLIQNFLLSQSANYWTTIQPTDIPQQLIQHRIIKPDAARLLSLNYEALKTLYASAPMEFTNAASTNPLKVSLPMPDQSFAEFNIWESPIFENNSNTQLGIKTYTGQGISDKTATIKIDFGANGFHAMILSHVNGDVFIDPYTLRSNQFYQSYFRKSFNPTDKPKGICKGVVNRSATTQTPIVLAGVGNQLRTYRLAVACTGEYSDFFGPSLANTVAAIATSVNRVNGVYEKELSIRMILVASNNNVVFTDPATDPFTGNDDAGILINESQDEISARIGSANFDIGHTFSTGAGGLAGLGVVCLAPFKASGVTGSPAPVGDPYDIDYVAHEIGHQFNGDHSFNGNDGSCAGSSRNGPTAYEVGSGTTIQAYAGICNAQNVQNNSDPFFHTISFDEMVAYSTNGSTGGLCPTITATGNNFPIVNTGTGGFTIPKNTPFTLTGSATDPNGDPLTYCWEQFDLGIAGLNNSTSTSGPNFRSYAPVSSPTRTFPRINDIANNSTSFREVLYDGATNRTFNFRLTARDNRATGGGVDYAPLTFFVSGTIGPLVVTTPNTAVTWAGNSTQTVNWNVNSTTSAPVNCANVRITLSTDGGITYPTVILASTPNDGSESITIPNIATTTARIRVECVFSNYSFFDISNTNFTITFTTPVKLTRLNAYKNNNQAICEWQSSQEINFSHYEIEKSTNGIDFIKIGTVNGNGVDVNIPQNYRFEDPTPLASKNYYRLKMIDKDRTFDYSKIVLLKNTELLDISILPNPSSQFVTIQSNKIIGNATLSIIDQTGKTIFFQKNISNSFINETIDISKFSKGIYIVRIANQFIIMNQKLVVQ